MTDETNARPKTSDIQRRGLMLVLSSPSGAGKSTIARIAARCSRDSLR